MPGVGRQCCSAICQHTYCTDITQQKYPSIISPSFISVCICLSSVSVPIHLFMNRCKRRNIHPVFETSDHFPRQHPAARSSLKLLHQIRADTPAAICSHHSSYLYKQAPPQPHKAYGILVNISCLMIFLHAVGREHIFGALLGKRPDISHFLSALKE